MNAWLRHCLQRRIEFATGRRCARWALAAPGLSDAGREAIGVGDRRQPLRPPGVIGSTGRAHSLVAAAWTRDLVASDIEVDAVLEDAVVRAMCLPEELAEPPTAAGVAWSAAPFSIRKAVLNAWCPVVGTWLGYHDVRLEVDPAGGAAATNAEEVGFSAKER